MNWRLDLLSCIEILVAWLCVIYKVCRRSLRELLVEHWVRYSIVETTKKQVSKFINCFFPSNIAFPRLQNNQVFVETLTLE